MIAGKAHPQDEEAKQALRAVLELRRSPHVGSRMAFLEDYDLHMATRLVAGVDLWVNVPRPPLEASGTSGMKVVLNGGLNLSVLDGWWIEGYDGETGWAIATPDTDAVAQDDHDAAALYDLLEHQVIPLFYERDARRTAGRLDRAHEGVDVAADPALQRRTDAEGVAWRRSTPIGCLTVAGRDVPAATWGVSK